MQTPGQPHLPSPFHPHLHQQGLMMMQRLPTFSAFKYQSYLQSLCFGQDLMAPGYPTSDGSPSGLLGPSFLEGRVPAAAPSLPSQRPSPGPAEGDPPPFAAPQLSPGAFRPLNPSSSSSSSSPASFVVQQVPIFRDAESERLTPSSEHSSSSLDRLTPDDASQRTLRKRRAGGGLALTSLGGSVVLPGHCTCPVCGVTVRPHELQAHFQQEANLLGKIPKLVSRHNKDSQSSTSQAKRSSSPSSSSGPSSSSSASARRDSNEYRTNPTSRTEIYERVKTNRNCRLSARAGRAGAGSGEEYREAQCPVCHKHLQGTASQLNRHAEACLRKRDLDPGSSEDEDVDVEGTAGNGEDLFEADGEEEEYRWAGQTRVRLTSLLRGNFEACGFTTVRPSAEDDEDLNVDGDDTVTYGQPQYTESDVIPCGSSSTSREDMALRRALSTRNEEDPVEESQPSRTEQAQNEQLEDTPTNTEDLIPNGVKTERADGSEDEEGDRETHKLEEKQTQVVNTSYSTTPPTSYSSVTEGTFQTRHSDQRLLIAALHQQIAELRGSKSQAVQGVLKCLVCMDPYNKPVVSVGCWHVYCEECWLRTLGAKKLCPQCNTITSASDLRKIYM